MVTLLTLYVYVIIFSTHSWLIEGSSTISKRQDRVLQSFMFLRMLSICLLRKFWFRLKVSWGCQCLFSCNVILFIILTLGLTEFPITMGTPEFHAQGTQQMPYENGPTRNHGYTYYTHLLCSCSCFIVSSQFTQKPKLKF